MEIVKARSLWAGDELGQMRTAVALLVPTDPGLGVIPIRGDLHDGARSMLVEPAEHLDILFVQPISPERQLIRLDGMDAKAVLGEEQLAKDSATCAETGMVTRRHFDCAMAARSVEALQACGAPNT